MLTVETHARIENERAGPVPPTSETLLDRSNQVQVLSDRGPSVFIRDKPDGFAIDAIEAEPFPKERRLVDAGGPPTEGVQHRTGI